MCGVLGLGGDLRRWTAQERADARRLVALYKEIRPTIQHGTMHRLAPMDGEHLGAVAYVAADASETVVFAFGRAGDSGATEQLVRLRGLDSAARYADDAGRAYSGPRLMRAGLPFRLAGAPGSALVRLRSAATPLSR
jgi:alpha-galactosidase